MTSGLERAVGQAIGKVGQKAFAVVTSRRHNDKVRRDARTLVPVQVANDFLVELDEAEVRRLVDYLASPDFEEIALQFTLGRLLRDVPWEELTPNIREQLRFGLRSSVKLRGELLVTGVDVLLAALATAIEGESRRSGDHPRQDVGTPAVTAHLVAAAAANSLLLRTLGDLAEIHEFARALRAQVVAVHGRMRLPHLGVSRSVPYDQLYVEPRFVSSYSQDLTWDEATIAASTRRTVILGDPGAGKSTLAAKLAHDLAADLVADAEGRVPFLLVLRNFTSSFRTGGKGLVHYLEQVCREPYNLEPPPNAVDYLLRNGRAAVLLDGLDELMEPELRRRFVDLVHGFVSMYPLVPVVVLARRIGYLDAPLDQEEFELGAIAELDDGQVFRYAGRWFDLDESTPESERATMARSFLAESEEIRELRGNPLLLALLCAMYASEHYIPNNLAQVYEKCAVMLFERWDSMRGLTKPLQFQGRLRGAVQYLAWELFTAKDSGRAEPRHRIVRILTDYLIAKKFDEDDAHATAEQFVTFCTDRSWILTDVGATDREPRYGFTHRTFLEYFAAEHLVRTHPTADRLWQALRPRLSTGRWEVVAQIALQLLDRNVDGAIDELLRAAIGEPAADPAGRIGVHEFAARSLDYLYPGHDVVADVAAAVLNDVFPADVRLCFRYQFWRPSTSAEALRRHTPLHTLLLTGSPANQPIVRRALLAAMNDLVESGNDTAMAAAVAPIGFLRLWEEICREVRDRHEDVLAEWTERAPWAGIVAGGDLPLLVVRFGPAPLYRTYESIAGLRPSILSTLLGSGMPNLITPSSEGLAEALVSAPRPWLGGEDWWSELPGPSSIIFPRPEERLSDPVLLLLLPLIELHEHGYRVSALLENSRMLHELFNARIQLRNRPIASLVRSITPVVDTQDFLAAWMRKEFDLLEPPFRN